MIAFVLGDVVRIKKNGMIGDIVHIYESDGVMWYCVEGGEDDRYEGAYPDEKSPFPLFDCRTEEIEYPRKAP